MSDVDPLAELAALTLHAGGKIIAARGIPKGRKKVRALAAKEANLLRAESEFACHW